MLPSSVPSFTGDTLFSSSIVRFSCFFLPVCGVNVLLLSASFVPLLCLYLIRFDLVALCTVIFHCSAPPFLPALRPSLSRPPIWCISIPISRPSLNCFSCMLISCLTRLRDSIFSHTSFLCIILLIYSSQQSSRFFCTILFLYKYFSTFTVPPMSIFGIFSHFFSLIFCLFMLVQPLFLALIISSALLFLPPHYFFLLISSLLSLPPYYF